MHELFVAIIIGIILLAAVRNEALTLLGIAIFISIAIGMCWGVVEP